MSRVESRRRKFRTRSDKRVNRNPLRKIVGEHWEGAGLIEDQPITVLYEDLECGHKQRKKSDFFGPTNAYRRRCRECGRGKPAEAAATVCPQCGSDDPNLLIVERLRGVDGEGNERSAGCFVTSHHKFHDGHMSLRRTEMEYRQDPARGETRDV